MLGAVCAAGAVVLSAQPSAAIGPDVDSFTFSGATGSLSLAIGLLSSSGTYHVLEFPMCVRFERFERFDI